MLGVEPSASRLYSFGWRHFGDTLSAELRLACATFVACEILPIFFPDTVVMRRRLGREFIPSFAVSPAAG